MSEARIDSSHESQHCAIHPYASSVASQNKDLLCEKLEAAPSSQVSISRGSGEPEVRETRTRIIHEPSHIHEDDRRGKQLPKERPRSSERRDISPPLPSLRSRSVVDRDEKKSEKKRPGRPRKTPIAEPQVRTGISAHPRNHRNFLELEHDMPTNFKRVWAFFKAMNVPNIQAIFRPTDCILYTVDHFGKSQIRVRIDCSKIQHYYLKDEYEVGIDSNKFEHVMNKITSGYKGIRITSGLAFKDSDINVTIQPPVPIYEAHTVNLVNEYPRMEDELKFLNTDHIISFELQGKYFKKMLTDIKGCQSDMIEICQESVSHPLTFEYRSNDKKLFGKNRIRDPKDFKFISKLKDDNQFSTKVKISYLKPLSVALPPDSIAIHANDKGPLLSVINIEDGIIEIRVLTATEIVDDD